MDDEDNSFNTLMNERPLHVLISPGFLIGLCLLLLNDFVLKQQFHNAFTGKASDFAGLFIFPLFWSVLFPRLKFSVYIFTAVSFIFWKSTYSQPVIDLWNSLAFFPVARRVDYSDLLSLVSLPLAYVYGSRALPLPAPSPRSVVYLIGFFSLFAFTATSFSKRTAYGNEYQFEGSRAELVQRMSRLPVNDVNTNFGKFDTFSIRFDSCTDTAVITIREKDNHSFIVLKEIDFRCPSGGDKQQMLEYFEKEFIDKLREEPVTKSPQVQYIWSFPEEHMQPPLNSYY